MVNDYSDEGKLRLFPYDTRYRPIAPPETGIFDEPTAKVCINVEWLAHIDGALERLLWRDAWAGDLDTQLAAVAEIRKLLAAMQERVDCCDCEDCMNCEELITCLTPLFNALNARLDGIEGQVQAVQEQFDTSSRVQAPIPASVPDCNPAKAYSGCVAAVEHINDVIIDIYERAEAEGADNANELTAIIFEALPVFETLPIDELYELVNWMFQNQQDTYEADYTTTWRDEAACQLWCLVQGDCTLNHQRIGMWLTGLEDAFPGNLAAEIFTRFGNATEPTMANQIGALINTLRGGQSLAAFFDAIIVQFGIGAQTENPGYTACECPECVEETTSYVTGENVEEWELGEYGAIVEDNYLDSTYGYGPNPVIGGYNSYRGVHIIRSFGGVTFQRIELDFEYIAGLLDTGVGEGADTTLAIYVDGTPLEQIFEPETPDSPYVWEGSITGDELQISITCGAHHDTLEDIDPGGTARLLTVTVCTF